MRHRHQDRRSRVIAGQTPTNRVGNGPIDVCGASDLASKGAVMTASHHGCPRPPAVARSARTAGVTVLDALRGACLDSRPQPNTGSERDEYPASVGREIRWLVETGATTAANGPGSLRTERASGVSRRRK